MNKRIKELRKALGLSGEKFGATIGLTKHSISNIENGRYSLTEQSIKSICREFNVNEDWLRTGNGDMFNALNEMDLNALVSDLEPLEINMLKAYFSLDKELRLKVLKHFTDLINKN